MVLTAVHYLLMAWYFVGPVAALAVAIVIAVRTGRRAAVLSWGVTLCTAVGLGVAMAFIYATAADGRVMPMQAALAAYFAAGMLFLLKGFDYVLRRITSRREPPPSPDGTPAPARSKFTLAAQMGFVVRVVVLFVIGLPYVMAAVMTYRPKVAPAQFPTMDYETVQFPAADGTRLVGWWIPARPAPQDAAPDWGRRTLLVCHGLASSKSNHLIMGQWGPTRGFNVLIFDFRAHGESGGQLTTFGDRERYDVLGAVRWLRGNRPEQSERIVGIGASMGAAAMIAAAADDSDEGRAIDALIVYGTYARLGGLARSVADQHFVRPVNLLVRYLAVPMGSAHVNARLTQFAPADHAATLWPRPIMVVHGLRDEIIPFEQGEWLYAAASPPKEFRPIARAGHNDIIEDPAVLADVQHFAETARSVPRI